MVDNDSSQQCRNCSRAFVINRADLDFYMKIDSPAPTWCPDCRTMRRMAHCNEGVLYSSSCDMCGKRVISQYASGHSWPVYCVECWWSDKWSGNSYGCSVDLERSLLEQFRELESKVPHACVSTDLSNINSEYTHHAGQEKNCYFIFHATFCDSCFYGYGVKKCTDCVDVHNCFESELCYECVDVDRCYALAWSQDCLNCSSSYFLRDCIGCSNCFLCVGLRNQQFCFGNQQLSREEYEARVSGVDLGSSTVVSSLQAELQKLQLRHPFKALRTTQSEDSSGNYLINAKDSHDCFDCRDVEKCRYCSQLQLGSLCCYDIYQFGNRMELCYEGAMIGSNAYNVRFSSLCIWQVSNLTYCIDCYCSSDCFLCFGLRHAKFCILNKPYSQAEYLRLKPLLMQRMLDDGSYGEFFPVHFSQFGYNETTAQRWFPLTREEVLSRGWKWQDSLPGTRGRETMQQIPENINQVSASIIDEILQCQECAKNFKIIEPELAFYQKRGFPLPRLCFECRRTHRMKKRTPRKFWERHCEQCGVHLKTTHAPTSSEIVYCDQCYLAAVG